MKRRRLRFAYRVLPLVTGLACLWIGGPVDASPDSRAAEFEPLDLGRLKWYAKRGFASAEKGGFDTSTPGIKGPLSLPIFTNRYFLNSYLSRVSPVIGVDFAQFP